MRGTATYQYGGILASIYRSGGASSCVVWKPRSMRAVEGSHINDGGGGDATLGGARDSYSIGMRVNWRQLRSVDGNTYMNALTVFECNVREEPAIAMFIHCDK